LESAIINNYLEVVIANFEIPEEITEKQFHLVIVNDRIDILNWWNNHGLDITANEDIMRIAVDYRSIEITKLLLRMGLDGDYDIIIGYSDTELRNLFEKLNLPVTEAAVSDALLENNIGALNWLEKQNINIRAGTDYLVGEVNGIEAALINGNIEALEWLAQRDIWPDEDNINNLIEERDYSQSEEDLERMDLSLKWLRDHALLE
jgi:hypothetical protein